MIRAQVQPLSNGCFNRVTTYGAANNAIDSRTKFTYDSINDFFEIVDTYDKRTDFPSVYRVLGWNTNSGVPQWNFDTSFNNVAGTSQILHFSCDWSENCGELTTSKDYYDTIQIFTSYQYSYTSEGILCADENFATSTSYTTSLCSSQSGTIALTIDNDDYDTRHVYFAHLADVKNPQVSSIEQSLPLYPSTPATAASYEVCIL